MKEDRINIITSRQLMVLIISAMTGVGVISPPYLLSKKVGHDGWIPLLLSGIISIIMAVIEINLLKRFGNKAIFSINTVLYGKYISTLLNTIYILYLVLKVSINLRIIVDVTKDIVLKSTPSIVISILILIATVYLVWYGLKPICRFANLVYVILLMVFALYIVNLKSVRLTFLMPVGECTLPSVFDSMRVTAYSFLAFAFPWVVYPMITDKEKALKYTISALIFSTIFFISVSVITTGVFGENMLKHQRFPLYFLALSYEAPIVERIDLFFMAFWFSAMLMSLIAYYFVTHYWIDKLLNIKRKTLSMAVFTAAVIIVSRLPRNPTQVNKYLELADTVGVPLLFSMTIFGYIFSFINTKEVQKK